MGVFKKSHEKDETKDAESQSYRAPSDTGSSDDPNAIAGANKRGLGGAEQQDALSGAAPLREGATTTTTTDSVRDQGAVETKDPNELDKRSPEERLKQLRGWQKRVKMGGPMQADWEEFDKLIGEERSIADARRP